MQLCDCQNYCNILQIFQFINVCSFSLKLFLFYETVSVTIFLKIMNVVCAYSSILGRVFEWKVKGHFLEKKSTFLCEKGTQDPKLP